MKVYVLVQLRHPDDPDGILGVFMTVEAAKARVPRRQLWEQDGLSWFSWGRGGDYQIIEHEVHE